MPSSYITYTSTMAQSSLKGHTLHHATLEIAKVGVLENDACWPLTAHTLKK